MENIQMTYIIVRNRTPYARSRSEMEENLRKDGKSSLTDEQLDRCRKIEHNVEEKFGMKGCMVDKAQIDTTPI
jgi:hypothetical protein